SLTTTFCSTPAMLRVSRLTSEICVVLLIIVVLLTITVLGVIRSWKRGPSTNTNKDGATTTPRGRSGAQPMWPPPTRQETHAGAHSIPGTQTQPPGSYTHQP